MKSPRLLPLVSRSLVFGCWLAVSIAGAATDAPTPSTPHQIAPGPFEANWDSLGSKYQCPEWFRDAKFGLWAHWSAQCVPEEGDWYARNMYIQGSKQYNYHLAHYGHPSVFGFMELDNLWKADKWEPEKLMQLYKNAGAKYFVALANHHDNFDAYDSKYQPWNSVNIGPKKDIVGIWAKVARENGLRFGVSNHSSHAWHWFQPAYGHDVEGDKAGVPYDAATLTKADGKGKWWDGLDPQDLYAGLRLPMPETLKTAKEAEDWHKKNDGHWYESVPPNDDGYTEKWFLRTQDLLDKYHPDLLYFDDTELPLEQAGLDIAAHFYNADQSRHGGKLEAVLNTKGLKPAHRSSMVQDYERGFSDIIQPFPWQTDTCIGAWHYDRNIFKNHRYKTVGQVARMLVDIVSKNGNLLLSVPVRGDGTIDEDEVQFLEGFGRWMKVASEGIYGSRPWKVYGEGPTQVQGGMFNENKAKLGARDIRFTTKDGALYAYILGWPEDGKVSIQSLAAATAEKPALLEKEIASIDLLGSPEKLEWKRDGAGLQMTLPTTKPEGEVYAFKITTNN